MNDEGSSFSRGSINYVAERLLFTPPALLALTIGTFGIDLASITTKVMGLDESSVTLILLLCGVGMTIGVLLAGPLTDLAARPTAYAALGGLAAVLVVFSFVAHVAWAAMIMVVLLGAVGFLMTAPLQVMVIRAASDAPTLASASNHSAFNLANAGGVWLGGAVIAAGWGWMSTALAGAVLAAIGLAIALVAGFLARGTGGDSGDLKQTAGDAASVNA